MRITPCTKLYVFKLRYAREKIGVGGVSLSSSVVSLFRWIKHLEQLEI
jgi:hypothetical protein